MGGLPDVLKSLLMVLHVSCLLLLVEAFGLLGTASSGTSRFSRSYLGCNHAISRAMLLVLEFFINPEKHVSPVLFFFGGGGGGVCVCVVDELPCGALGRHLCINLV